MLTKKTRASALAIVLMCAAVGCGDDDAKSSDQGETGGTGTGGEGDAGSNGKPGEMDSSVPEAKGDASVAHDSGSNGSTEDAGPDQASCVPMADDAGAECNSLVSEATGVAIVKGTGTTPVGKGGTIVAGHYVLTEAKSYPGSTLPEGVVVTQDVEICGGFLQVVQVIGGTTERKTSTIAPDGIKPNLKMTCSTKESDMDSDWTSYTATATTISIYSATEKMSLSFTKE